jgi:hypothetical protein
VTHVKPLKAKKPAKAHKVPKPKHSAAKRPPKPAPASTAAPEKSGERAGNGKP